MTKLLADLFKEIGPDEMDKVLYLLQGRLAPQYVKIDFGLGEKMVLRAVEKALNMDHKVFMNEYKKVGDIGKTVEEFKKTIRSIMETDMSVGDVYDRLLKLAQASGEGSQDDKISRLVDLVQTVDGLSARYIVRIPTNTLRLGFSDMTILDAFSWMLTGDKSLRETIQRSYHVRPDLGELGKVVKKDGVQGLIGIQPKVFTPILMMKAQRLPSTKDIIEKIGTGVVESKYDGFRLQVHYRKNKTGAEVKLFSRGLEDVTFMYPDIVEGVKKEIKADKMIFEGEAIGFDEHTGNFLPFQETVQRKRKYDISEKAKEIPLKMFAFELLMVNDISHMETPLKERAELLRSHIKLHGDIFKDTILISPEVIAATESEIDVLFEEAIAKGLEGVMVKKLDGIYQPGARGWNWIKYKRSYSHKIDDTIDCLVMGYDVGKGKRAGFGIGAFLVGIYDQESDQFKTVAKIGTGLSDDEWRELKKRSDKISSQNKPALYDVDKIMDVDVWVKPQIVVEIRADEITRSSMHTAGRTLKPSKTGKAQDVDTLGYALRFPRLEKFRSDKTPEDATSVAEVQEMFESRQ
jgi:DNA ligase-1